MFRSASRKAAPRAERIRVGDEGGILHPDMDGNY